ncbi:MAG TPA: exodeoxyribonuclease VII large subunit [Burkholderiaceae bacterium]|jgi:exodeoxyribonuclease VII large subunit|nr:exodeoxyribonuclease VII large subunit [Burkholderiaceae bacterium]
MELDFEGRNAENTRPALTVSALNRAVSGLLQRSFPLVRVRGEIANVTRATSGHWYFALKDDQAQVRCVMFRTRNVLLGWMPRDGDAVEVDAVVSLYEARGEFQLGVESMRRAGQGRFFEEFLRLKAQLAAEGLFASERKRRLPRIPRRVAIVTSMQAAALPDVVTTLCRRAQYVGVVVCPVPVQGLGAGAQIADMLARVGRRAAQDAVDVVLLVRGGGSIEDLWPFNEEIVARAIGACPIPVIVGVGHESDVTIADFAADLRAPTPTAAAELVAPAASALLGDVRRCAQQLRRVQALRMQALEQRLDYAQRALAKPRMPLLALDSRARSLQSRASGSIAQLLAVRRAKLGRLRERLLGARRAGLAVQPSERVAALAAHVARCVSFHSMRLASVAARLHAIDPHAVLARGYTIALGRDGRAVTDAARLRSGDELQLLFASGKAHAQVQSVLTKRDADVER